MPMQDKNEKDQVAENKAQDPIKAPLKIEDLTAPASQDEAPVRPPDLSPDRPKETLQEAVANRKNSGEEETPKSIRDIALDIAEPFRLPKRKDISKKSSGKEGHTAYPTLSSSGLSDGLAQDEDKAPQGEKVGPAQVILPGDQTPCDDGRLQGDAQPLVLIQPEKSPKARNVQPKKPLSVLPKAQEKPAKGGPGLLSRFWPSRSKDQVQEAPKAPKEEAPNQGGVAVGKRDETPVEEPSLAPEVSRPSAETAPEETGPHLDSPRPEADVHQAREDLAEWEMEQALEAAGIDSARSTCEELRQLETQLREGKSPWRQEKNVIIERKPALQLIQGLTALCDSKAGDGFEDELFDTLASSSHLEEGDFKPMYRVKSRAKGILEDASRQADDILNDARILSNKLLRDTDAKIQEKYDQADMEIEQRISSSKEASVKHLTEAREELTASRKQSVDILNMYLNKAEDDYQGYWERAEQTLMASLWRSDQVLEKAVDIYKKELLAIGEDLQVLREILEDLSRRRP